MSYIPPNKRNKNNFHVKIKLSNEKKNTSTPTAPNVESLENFPSIGTMTTNTTKTTSIANSEMSFASSLFIPQPKKEIIKEVPDGWIHIRKNKTPRFLVGKHSERYYDINDYVAYMSDIRVHNAYHNMIERHEYYKELDEELNGPTYINSWEYDEIRKEQEQEYKLALLDEALTSDDSSEDEMLYDYN